MASQFLLFFGFVKYTTKKYIYPTMVPSNYSEKFLFGRISSKYICMKKKMLSGCDAVFFLRSLVWLLLFHILGGVIKCTFIIDESSNPKDG